jgi:hypothetical protein
MVEMKHTKFVINEFKRKILGDPKPTAVKMPENIKKSKPFKLPKIDLPDMGPSAISGIAIATLVFLIVLTVYGQVASAINTSSVGNASLMNLINLIPLVLVGAAIIGIILVAFRLSE